MKLADLMDPDVKRAFAARMDALPRDLFYGPGAAADLAAALRRELPAGRTAVLLADVRTRAAAGDACYAALAEAGWRVEEAGVPDGPAGAPPHCNDATKARLQRTLPDADVLVAVGGGVVNDLTKWLAADAARPYAVFATAASMNGYAAANVAPTVDGVKTLATARAPRVIAADPEVLQRAPARLAAAGLGDLLARGTSGTDWLANHMLFEQEYDASLAALSEGAEAPVLDNPSALAAAEPEAVRGLFEGLVLSGCAMTLFGSSQPASGGEHLVSHALDMTAPVAGLPHDLHGRQVGVATVFCAALYARVLACERPAARPAPIPFETSFWGPLADAVRPRHAEASANLQRAAAALQKPGAWDALREALAARVPSAEGVRALLRDARAACGPADIGCARERFTAAVRNAAGMRERFTSLGLAHVAGALPGAADEIAEACFG